MKQNYKTLSRNRDAGIQQTVGRDGPRRQAAAPLQHVCSTEYYCKKGVAAYLNL